MPDSRDTPSEIPPPPAGSKPVAKPCPACGATECLRIEEKLRAQQPGTFSLAGVQTKFPAQPVVMLVCRACGAQAEGKVEEGGTHVNFNPEEMRAGDHAR